MNEFDLFQSALDIEDPAARQSFLKAACEQDAELLRRVEALLGSHEDHSQFLNTPVVEQMADVSDVGTTTTLFLGNGSTHVEARDETDLYFHGLEVMTEHHDDSDNEISLGYLEPSSKPGSLGRLAHYEVLEVIGRGAFGTVLRAFDEKLQRVVAIKVMAPELASTSPARKRFLREAQASAAIRHEHVVSVYAVEEKPLPYLVMEFIPGETLQRRLDEHGPLDVPDVLQLGRQIAEGLAAAHAINLIHRDIKPGNILLETGVREKVKITDFGLARAADDASLTQSGTIAGTPMYMAPEQALGHKLDQRADLFSFGSVLYQMVSGRPPFRAANTLAVLKRVTEDTPRPITEIIPETPQWLCDIITKLHAKNPEDRYQSAREVADLLADCEAQLKAHATLQDFSSIPKTKSASGFGNWRWIMVGALTVLALMAIVIITIKTKDGKETKVTINSPGDVAGISTEVKSDGAAASSPLKASADVSAVQPGHKDQGWHGWPADAPLPAVAPFDASGAGKHQEEWAAYLKMPVESTNSIGMKFRLIPLGRFNTQPDRRVTISKPFQMAAYETTIGQFQAFVNETGYRTSAEKSATGMVVRIEGSPAEFSPDFTWRHQDVTGGNDYPVGQLSWDDAVEFCQWLSRKEGKSYRLPTEAEWEWACRAGSVTDNHFDIDKESLDDYAWYAGNSGARSHPVGQKKPNRWGLYDMHGNMAEFCQDWLAPFEAGDVVDPTGPASGTTRSIRSFGFFSNVLKISQRGFFHPGGSMNHFEFRVVCELGPAKGTVGD